MNSNLPQRQYGLPSNPRQGPSLKHTKSQSALGRGYPKISTAEPLPSRGGTVSREAPAPYGVSARSSLPTTPLEHPVAPSVPSGSAVPLVKVSLKSASGRHWEPSPSTRNHFDDSPPIPSKDPAELVGDDSNELAPLWKKMADMLTINVSKALAANIGEGDGEATPLGAESRLTRAMKAYHLEKARGHSDLPDWLFDDTERRTKPLLQQENRDEIRPPDDLEPVLHPVHRPAHSQDSAKDQETRTSVPKTTRNGNAGDRLKAMRERQRRSEKAAPMPHPIFSGFRRS